MRLWQQGRRTRMLETVMSAFRGRFAGVAFLGAVVAASSLPWGRASAAAPNQLSNPAVSPTNGDTATTFSFSVHYVGTHDATTVTALAGGRTIVLSLTSGTALDGYYAGSSTLPAGTWTAAFAAIAPKGNSPSIIGPMVTVTAVIPSSPPGITPAPIATPAVVPTAAPQATAPPAAPQATSVPPAAVPVTPIPAAAMPAGSTAESLGGGGLTSFAPGDGELVPSLFWPVMLGGFGLIGLVVVYSIFVMGRDRRRRAVEAEMAFSAQQSVGATSAASRPQRIPASWERDAQLEEAPIGTVEYQPLQEGQEPGG
jgi:hypothetical protein